MKNKQAFTLIELLVVVLIIGVLAAVALPQYQKAVLKSRFAALKPLAKAVKNAQEIYYNEHGEYAPQLSALDIQAPADAELDLSDTDGHEFVRAKKTGLNNRYTMYFDHSTQFAGNVYCEALTTDTQAMDVCAGEGGTGHTETNGEYTLYLLSGNGTGSFVTTPQLLETLYNQHCPQGGGPCTIYNYDDASRIAVKDEGYQVHICIDNCTEILSYWNTGGDRFCRSDSCVGETDFCDRFPDIEQCKS